MIYFIIGWYVIGVVFGILCEKAESGMVSVKGIVLCLFVGGIGGPLVMFYWLAAHAFKSIYKGSKLQKFMDKELF